MDPVDVGHDSVAHTDWVATVDAWMRELVDRHAARAAYLPSQGQPQPGYGDPYATGYAHKGDGYGYGDHGHGDHHGHSDGPGVGTVIAAGAAGLAVGVVGGMVVSELLDDDGGDEDSGDDES